jgi:hypothetical protein
MSIDIGFEALHQLINACHEIDRLRDDKHTLLVALRAALPVLYRSGDIEAIEIAEAALTAVERK